MTFDPNLNKILVSILTFCLILIVVETNWIPSRPLDINQCCFQTGLNLLKHINSQHLGEALNILNSKSSLQFALCTDSHWTVTHTRTHTSVAAGGVSPVSAPTDGVYR